MKKTKKLAICAFATAMIVLFLASTVTAATPVTVGFNNAVYYYPGPAGGCQSTKMTDQLFIQGGKKVIVYNGYPTNTAIIGATSCGFMGYCPGNCVTGGHTIGPEYQIDKTGYYSFVGGGSYITLTYTPGTTCTNQCGGWEQPRCAADGSVEYCTCKLVSGTICEGKLNCYAWEKASCGTGKTCNTAGINMGSCSNYPGYIDPSNPWPASDYYCCTYASNCSTEGATRCTGTYGGYEYQTCNRLSSPLTGQSYMQWQTTQNCINPPNLQCAPGRGCYDPNATTCRTDSEKINNVCMDYTGGASPNCTQSSYIDGCQVKNFVTYTAIGGSCVPATTNNDPRCGTVSYTIGVNPPPSVEGLSAGYCTANGTDASGARKTNCEITPPATTTAVSVTASCITTNSSLPVDCKVNFGDGSSPLVFVGSIMQSSLGWMGSNFVLHNYPVGSYNIVLTRSDGSQIPQMGNVPTYVVLNVTNKQNPNQPPSVSLAASPASGEAPLAVNLTATGSDPEGQPLTYSFDCYGNGSFTAPNSSNTKSCNYPAGQTYNPSVVAYDNGSPQLSAEATATVEVSGLPNEAPTATLAAINPAQDATKAPPEVTIVAGQAVTFNAKCDDSDGTISKCEFFENSVLPAGPTAQLLAVKTQQTYSQTYGSPGTYSAALVATDNLGAQSQAGTVTVIVQASSTCGTDGGVIDGGEQCEGANVGTNTCESLGCTGGTLSCNASTCALDISGCTGCIIPAAAKPSVGSVSTEFVPSADGITTTLKVTATISNPNSANTVKFLVSEKDSTAAPEESVPQSQGATVMFNTTSPLKDGAIYVVSAVLSGDCSKCTATKYVSFAPIKKVNVPETSLFLVPIIALVVLAIIRKH